MLGIPTRLDAPQLWDRTRSGHHHEPTKGNPVAMNSGRGGLRRLRSQGGGGSGYVEVNGIYVPLQGVNPQNPLMGGYGFGDWTDGGHTHHPGVDLNSGSSCNADLRAGIVAPTDGTVVAVLPWDGHTSGEGNHFWLYLDDVRCCAPAWAHFDHCDEVYVVEGQRVSAGEVIATCGNTGNWECAHSHEELARAQPSSWWQWPYGWSMAAVEASYFDPAVWYAATAEKASGTWTEDVPMDVTQEELNDMAPYFALYGVSPNMATAIMHRAGLAYKRDETPGPCLTDEYPHGPYVRQDFTARTAEYHPDDGGVYWVELNKEARGIG